MNKIICAFAKVAHAHKSYSGTDCMISLVFVILGYDEQYVSKVLGK